MIATPHRTDNAILTSVAATQQDARYKIMLGVSYILLVIIWSFTIPFSGAPDESTHFYLLDYIFTLHEFPTTINTPQAFSGELTHHTWRAGSFWYHGLPFPHVVGGLITTTIASYLLPENLLYLGARIFNWTLAGLFITALYRIARAHELLPRTSALIAVAVSLIPQVSFIFSYFNSDAYGITVIAMSLAALLDLNSRPTLNNAIQLGACVGLLLLAKLYFLPSIVFIVAIIISRLYFKGINLKLMAALLASALIVAAPMLIFTYSTFGEITGVSGQVAFVEMHRNDPGSTAGTCYLICGDKLINFQTLAPWLRMSAMSYFSVTGWMNIYIQSWQYMIAEVVGCTAIATALLSTIFSYKKLEKKDFYLEHALPLIMILGMIPSIVILSIIGSQLAMPQPQGRYLFVTIPFMAYMLALTCRAFTMKSKLSVSEHA
ncbi:DUF2142 domain-containing protein [Pseudomonas sp. Irchel 3A5]|uniref:DUF2142 domain-containing protein n=1 Tax=Pseudomonas sp. Irchel 3A5 TaxID=2008911 RepID=UPI000BA37B5E|nr:DUF2142 domain-containing protein [Pseudomonas sp. Irchel 3A5]